MVGYVVSCVVLGIIAAAFIPAMIASYKNYSFFRWYLYGAALFPIALVHSILVKKMVTKINVFSNTSDRRRKKKTYQLVPAEKKCPRVSLPYLFIVFFTKLIFCAFVGLAAFALVRLFDNDSIALRITCIIFSFVLTLLFSATEICGLSRVTIFADEITKRALFMCALSVLVSIPFFVIKGLIFDNFFPQYSDFCRLIFVLLSLAIFVGLLFKMQGYYYSVFYKFFDYCVLSLFAYSIFAAITLILRTLPGLSKISYAVAMPMQLLNLKFVSDMGYIELLSGVYQEALMHLFVAVLIFLSGILCSKYKKREAAARVEYRTKAFRMSRKRVLRRHIVKAGMEIVRPINHV